MALAELSSKNKSRAVARGLRLFNTLTQRKESFRSLEPGRAKVFVCGPTIQDLIHVGHARTYLFYDVLVRYLSFLGHRVEFVVNVTDIDESIVKGARAGGKSVEAFTSGRLADFLADMKSLGIQGVDYDRVSDHVPEMIGQVQGLLKGGHAYGVGGTVYFSIDTFPRFGRLSRQSRYQISLRPLEVAEGKRNQADFSLWRDSGAGEQKWDSPWGKGTPGWHIQDTAVSFSHFGAQYDVHGGARELVYPHHEAQIAEMEALTGKRPFVRYWVHSGLLTQSSEKMAKSRGNVVRVREVLKRHSMGALRLYMLSMHHGRDAEFREAELQKWEETSRGMKRAVKTLSRRGRALKHGTSTEEFLRAMDDDMHADRAIRILVKEVTSAAGSDDPGRRGEALGLARVAERILGLELEAS